MRSNNNQLLRRVGRGYVTLFYFTYKCRLEAIKNTDLAGLLLRNVADVVVASWAAFLPLAVLVVDPLVEGLKKNQERTRYGELAF